MTGLCVYTARRHSLIRIEREAGDGKRWRDCEVKIRKSRKDGIKKR